MLWSNDITATQKLLVFIGNLTSQSYTQTLVYNHKDCNNVMDSNGYSLNTKMHFLIISIDAFRSMRSRLPNAKKIFHRVIKFYGGVH